MKLFGLLRDFKREVAYVALLSMVSMVSNLMMLAPTIYMLQLYDRVMVSRNELTLVAVTVMTCFLLLMMALAEWLRSTLAIKAGMRFDQAYSHWIFSYAFSAQALGSTAQVGQPLKDLTAVRQFLTGNGLFAFFDLPWSLLYVAVLFVLSPVLGSLAVLFCLIQLGLAWWNHVGSDAALQRSMQVQNRAETFLQGKLRQLESVSVMGISPHLYRRWLGMQVESGWQEAGAQVQLNRLQFASKLARYCMQSLTLGAAAYLVIHGRISVGSMIASSVLIARALQPFDVIVGTWKQYVQAWEAGLRLIPLQEAVRLPEVQGARPDIRGELVLKAVSVRQDERTVLSNLNLEIRPGRILTVMGASGSGKSTLARTLLGLVGHADGEVFIDDVLLRDIDALHLAAAVGYLPQDVSLLEGTIAENIARFGPLESAHIIAACQLVGMHEAILRLPMGYETHLGENGEPLSCGQRQLIGLARAIYRNPAFVVLDEPNSSLDEFGDASLLRVLQQLRSRGGSVVVISHRTGVLKVTDDLLILKHGEIVHHGPRDAGIAYLNQHQVMSMGNAA